MIEVLDCKDDTILHVDTCKAHRYVMFVLYIECAEKGRWGDAGGVTSIQAALGHRDGRSSAT